MRKQGLLRTCRWRWLAASLVALALSTGARAANAGNEPGDAKQAAKARFTAGQKHYNLNEFPEALREFKEAYRLYSDPVFLFNLGQCERQLGHAEEAIRFYRSYLREQPKAPNRAEVQRRIDEMETLLKTKQAEAEKATGPAAPAETVAPPPDHVPTAPAPAAPAAAEVPAAPAPQSSPETQAMPAQAAPAAPRIDLTTTPTTPDEPVPVYKRWWVWTAAAAVVVGAGIGIYAATANKNPAVPDSGLGSKKVF